ncbi:hypothetical protein [Sphingomonas sp. LK11]|jgi:hypothetical protein|uniref:hypothetical protein n=1 Tax=Sphingomonas sp. LK11 TaxID=1390395 RepID=UPI0012EB2560|nr:hypothetical protein [Sphingomonas sp. LK11]
MKAKLTTYLAGEPNRLPGEMVEGEEAVRLCAAGFATPVVEQREKAVKKTPAKETREAK